jgi:D-3-phosphoglycerate dehydrogenase
MPQKTVLATAPIHPTALKRLRRETRVLAPYRASRKDILAQLSQANGIILGSFPFGAAEMDLAPHLQVVGRHGIGLDRVDLAAATERGLPVVYTPDGPTESTAEHALLLILAAARRLSQLDRAVRSGRFDIRNQAEAMGTELEGKTLGVVGFGRIGRRVAQMCRDALRMSVLAYDPYLSPDDVAACGAHQAADLFELAANADVLTIHTPLTPETRGLIDRRVIWAMKPGSLLVNASRGAVVDEAALIEALQEGHLGGAGLDVFDPTPPAPDNPLLQMEQVVLTPHVGSFTDEGRKRMGLTVVEDILRVLAGEKPHYLANPGVWP